MNVPALFDTIHELEAKVEEMSQYIEGTENLMAELLEQNARLRRENEALRSKLSELPKAVDP